MGRHKTISDADVLAIARGVFRARGHAASTREIARSAGLSEAVLYQRFRNKDALFFAATAPSAPDILGMLGPDDPPPDARAYVITVVERMRAYFEEMLPLAMQVMMHPAFDITALAAVEAGAATNRLEAELTTRLAVYRRRRSIANCSPSEAATLLTSLAHDWALRGILSGGATKGDGQSLAGIVKRVWDGLAPSASSATARRRPGRRRRGRGPVGLAEG